MDDEIVKDLETETPDLDEPKRSQVINYENSSFFLFFPLAFFLELVHTYYWNMNIKKPFLYSIWPCSNFLLHLPFDHKS